MVASSLVIFGINMLFVWRIVPFSLRIDMVEWKRIIKTAPPIALAIVFTVLYFKLDTLFLSILKGPEEVGLYNAAYKVLENIIFFPAVLVGLFLPVLSRYALGQESRLKKALSALFDIMVVLALPVAVGGALLAATMVYLIGGGEFLASTTTLQILFGAVGVIFFGTLFGNSVVALDLQRKAVWVYGLGFAFNAVSNLVVIPRYSYVGAAWTTLATEVFVTVLLGVLVYRRSSFRPSYGVLGLALVATAAMGWVVWFFARPLGEPVSLVRFAALVLAGGGVYGLLSMTFLPRLIRQAKQMR